MTSTRKIKFWLSEVDHFIGCFKASKLPNFPSSFPKSLIINIDETKKVGHFVVVLLQKNYVIYFDSLGIRTLPLNVKNYLTKFYDCIYFNFYPVQDYQSLKCAYFCTLFIIHVKNLKDFQKYLNIFHKNKLLKNDNLIDFIFKMFNFYSIK